MLVMPILTYSQTGGQIPFQGLGANHEGVAAWNVPLGGLLEPSKTGHPLAWVTCTSNAVAFYYQASRDGAFLVDQASPGGIHGVAGLSGFSDFNSVLAANGFSIDQLTMTWGLQTLGNDVEGKDWWLDGVVETRFYSGGEFTIKLGGEDMVGGFMPRTAVIIDYDDVSDCTDDRISGHTDPVVPQDRSAASSAEVQAVAAAFLNDLGNNGIRFVFDSFQPAVQDPDFEENGRVGVFFDLQSGRIETNLPSIPMAWGASSDGQLGDGGPRLIIASAPRLTPGPVVNLTDVVTIEGGGLFSLALKSDGTVWWWGEDAFGTGTSTPEQVGALTDVVAIAAGWSHRLALKDDGSVWAWGRNNQGQLGNGCTISIDCADTDIPASVSGLSNVVAIAAGGHHSLALKSDGTVWAWGLNWDGQLGDNTTTSRSSPVQVLDPVNFFAGLPLTDVVAISGGGADFSEPHSLALKSNGTVLAWGANGFGQLGDGTNSPSSVPVQVIDPDDLTGVLNGIIDIAAGGRTIGNNGYAHSLALKHDGTVWA
ncbi:MAG: hypothetical protein R3268_05170, partial [Acidiferrobacterales bacterium]|nr:hypothetical protein [Acidiferrobacterales bacterium]